MLLPNLLGPYPSAAALSADASRESAAANGLRSPPRVQLGKARALADTGEIRVLSTIGLQDQPDVGSAAGGHHLRD
jgi:hypothetical protein